MSLLDPRNWFGSGGPESQTAIPTADVDPAHDTGEYRRARIIREQMALTRDTVIGVPLLDEAAALWFDFADAAGGAPPWGVFKPLEYPRLVPNLVLNEPIGDRFLCRLIGETANRYLPLKVEGLFLDEAIPPSVYTDVSTRLNRALSDGLPNLVQKALVRGSGDESVSYTSLQLPFPASESSPGRIVSVMHFQIEVHSI